jgi:DNA repair ATPase RecN
VYIEKIRLVNFQSWKNVTFELAEGLNILVGQNNAGKSVLMKALKAVIFPDKYSAIEREKLISYGASCAVVEIFFTDNTRFRFDLFLGGGYKYYMYVTEEDAIESVECFEELLSRLSVLVDKEAGTICNILDLDTQLLMVQAPPGESLMKAYIESAELNALIKNLNVFHENVLGLSKNSRKLLRPLQVIVEEMKYVDISYLENAKSDLENDMHILDILNMFTKHLENVTSSESIELNMDDVLFMFEVLTSLEDVAGVPVVFEEMFIEDLEFVANIHSNINTTEILDFILFESDDLLAADMMDAVYDSICSMTETTIPDIEFDSVLYLEEINSSIWFLNFNKTEETANSKTLDSVLKSLRVHNTVVDCPIYGEVVYLGDKCEVVR